MEYESTIVGFQLDGPGWAGGWWARGEHWCELVINVFILAQNKVYQELLPAHSGWPPYLFYQCPLSVIIACLSVELCPMKLDNPNKLEFS